MVFDRFDSLADAFCVQKVRKTVYESYMLAAGLPLINWTMAGACFLTCCERLPCLQSLSLQLSLPLL